MQIWLQANCPRIQGPLRTSQLSGTHMPTHADGRNRYAEPTFAFRQTIHSCPRSPATYMAADFISQGMHWAKDLGFGAVVRQKTYHACASPSLLSHGEDAWVTSPFSKAPNLQGRCIW